MTGTTKNGSCSDYLGLRAVTPSDTAELDPMARGLLIESPGTLKILCADGSIETFTTAPSYIPVQVRKVFATGTASTGIHALD